MTHDEFLDKAQTYWEHYQHACEKHPFFASRTMTPYPLVVFPDASEKYKKLTEKHNEAAIRLFKDLARDRKKARDEDPTAENVLNAEIGEIWLAVARGDLPQARYEIADAIAVLLRLDEALDELYELTINPSKAKAEQENKP